MERSHRARLALGVRERHSNVIMKHPTLELGYIFQEKDER